MCGTCTTVFCGRVKLHCTASISFYHKHQGTRVAVHQDATAALLHSNSIQNGRWCTCSTVYLLLHCTAQRCVILTVLRSNLLYCRSNYYRRVVVSLYCTAAQQSAALLHSNLIQKSRYCDEQVEPHDVAVAVNALYPDLTVSVSAVRVLPIRLHRCGWSCLHHD